MKVVIRIKSRDNGILKYLLEFVSENNEIHNLNQSYPTDNIWAACS
jgi:hypothetical protein